MEYNKEIKEKKGILLYDKECPLCYRFKELLKHLKAEEFLEFVSLEDFEQLPLGIKNNLSESDCHKVIHYIDEENIVHRGEEVIPALAHRLEGIKKYAWLLDSNMGQKATHHFYQFIEKARKIAKQKEQDDCYSCPRF